MKKQTRSLAALAAALVLVSLLAWGLLRSDGRAPEAEEARATAERTVLQGAVARVEIQSGGAGYALDAQGVEGLSAEVTDAARVSETLTALSELVLVPLEGEAAEDSVYGLGEGAVRAEVCFAGGGGYALEIGAEESVSGRRYCRLEGKAALFLMDGALGARLCGGREAYLSLQITPACQARSALSAVKSYVAEGDGEEIRIASCYDPDAEMALELLSFGAVTHVISGPGGLHEVDRTYAEEVFASLFDLKALEVVDYGLSAEEMDARGFDRPDLQLCVEVKNADAPETPTESWTLRILREEDGTALATVNDAGAVYRIADAAFMHARYGDFVSRWFFSPLMMDLSALRISTPAGDYNFEILGEAAELRVLRDGREVDLSRFRSFYTLAVSAASNGDAASEADAAQAPLARVEFVYRSEGKAPDVLALRALDARRLSVSVNGVTEFAMRSGYLDALQQGLDALEGGGEIPQTW